MRSVQYEGALPVRLVAHWCIIILCYEGMWVNHIPTQRRFTNLSGYLASCYKRLWQGYGKLKDLGGYNDDLFHDTIPLIAWSYRGEGNSLGYSVFRHWVFRRSLTFWTNLLSTKMGFLMRYIKCYPFTSVYVLMLTSHLVLHV